MGDSIENIDDYRYDPDKDKPCRRVTPSKPVRSKRQYPFICGPIDLDWISKAAHLPGKTINVALALMYLSGLNKSKDDLKLTRKIYDHFNISRSAVYGALENMEREGLIEVKKAPGRKNLITILETCKDGSDGKG